ncbi:MAG: lipoprotein-releasing ABC transporter permease subunit [Candidatus Omnitrophica bacterium]|nr:lipoprotein-releasing ABC transporter permease subunit [Candidatus Omnitrophota bacterium]
MRRFFELFISWRYLVSKRREKFISVITFISVLGITVGVTSLIVVIGVMTGFDNDLRDKIVGANPHIIVENETGIIEPDMLFDKLKEEKDVVGMAPFVSGEAMLNFNGRAAGVAMRGIDPLKEPSVTKFKEYMKKGGLPQGGQGIVLGIELCARYGITTGDKVKIFTSSGEEKEYIVEGIFESGMYDYDANLVLLNLADAQALLGANGKLSGIGLKVRDVHAVQNVKKGLEIKLGPTFIVRTWVDMNRNLFSALKLEKTVMFIILALIVVVACFNIISTLIMVVMEKTKEIGILKALGATNSSILAIFTLQGLIVGLAGTICGAIGGWGLTYMLKKYQFIKLPSDIYYLDRLPVQLQISDFSTIIIAALALTLISTIYPAWQASRLSPVEALRYE